MFAYRFLTATFMSLSLCVAGETWYVDKANGEEPWDGRGWDSAFTELQEAVDAAWQSGGWRSVGRRRHL